MAKRNFDKWVDEGKTLAKNPVNDIYTDEIHQLHERSVGEFDLIVRSYYLGLAAGYRARKREEAAKRKAKQSA